jgi:hypothetical protein
MGNRLVPVLALVASVAWPATAAAYSFMGRQRSAFTVGAGLNLQPGRNGGDTYVTPSADLGIRLGQRAVLRPAIGFCTGGDETNLTIGGAGSVNVWSNPAGRIAVDLQTHVARASGDGWSETAIPIVAAGSLNAGNAAAFFAGAGLVVGRSSYSMPGFSRSDTDTNPVGFAGVRLAAGNIDVSGALQLISTDHDTNTGIVIGGRVPIR